MSKILYYSNYCNHCKGLLMKLSKSEISEDIHFLCIDKRVKKEGKTYIKLENGQELMLPDLIKRVPSMILLNRGNMLLEGEAIDNELLPAIERSIEQATRNNGEPEAFGMDQFGSFHNDSYSFLDQNAEDMSAKGNGGMRQIHSYATLDFQSKIDTPPDNYTPDKIGNTSLEKIQQQRANDVPQQQRRIG